MNELETYLDSAKINPEQAMNALQLHGIISDLPVTPAEVAPTDQSNAIHWLKTHWDQLQDMDWC